MVAELVIDGWKCNYDVFLAALKQLVEDGTRFGSCNKVKLEPF